MSVCNCLAFCSTVIRSIGGQTHQRGARHPKHNPLFYYHRIVAGRDIIVIGGSAGGIEVLQRMVPGLPSDLPAAVFIVIHMAPWWKSELPRILTRIGRLPAIHPVSGESIERGRIYIAPPNQHLVIEDGSVLLSRGPKENRHRPAVDPLFRSAALSYGERVAGMVISGALDDGAAGLWWVKHHGGAAIVQDPQEASFPQMPSHALERTPVDYIVRTSEMSRLLTTLTGDLESSSQSPLPGLTAEELERCKRKNS